MSTWLPDGLLDAAIMTRCLHELLRRTDELTSYLPHCGVARLVREEQDIGREQVKDEIRAMLRELEEYSE